MTDTNQKQLGNTLWSIADQLRGAMDADDFRDYMLSFLFLRYLSDNYETAAKKELGRDYPKVDDDRSVPLALWYQKNKKDVPVFEKQMRRKVHYVIRPEHLWSSIANLARTQNAELLNTLQAGFKYIETESFENTFQDLFSGIDLGSSKLGKTHTDRNAMLCTIIQKIAEGLAEFSTEVDVLGDAYEYQHRTEAPRYPRRVEMAEIEKNDYNLNISRYISTAVARSRVLRFTRTRSAVPSAHPPPLPSHLRHQSPRAGRLPWRHRHCFAQGW